MNSLGVAAADAVGEAQASLLAEKLELPLLSGVISPASLDQPRAILFTSRSGLYLQLTGPGAPGPVLVQFGSAAMRHRRRAGQNELLGRAVGVGKKTSLCVLDATAGLGRDSFVLADLGCQVAMCERHPVIVELLASGLAQAHDSEDSWLEQVCARMVLCPGDAREVLPSQMLSSDVIYLDPMFPTRTKSASVKKEMVLLQALLEPLSTASDDNELLLWALDQDVARVVVKRPAKAPALAARKPSHVIAGKAVRYDVYVRTKIA